MSEKLRNWARWVLDDGVNYKLGYQSSMWLLMKRFTEVSSNKVRADVDVKEAEEVDKAVCLLAKHDTILHQVLCWHYLYGCSVNQIAIRHLSKLEKKRVSNHKAKSLLTEAEGFIEGVLAKNS